MKRKLLVTLLLVVAFVFVLSLSTSAAKYTINYDNKGTAETDENGTITLKDTKVIDLNGTEYTIKDKDGNDINITQEFLGWYTEDGRFFEPGETATFTEDTRLFQASGTTVYDYDGLNTLLGKGWWCVKLGADIEATKKISTCNGPSGTMSILNLNGHNITSSASDAFGAGRSGIMVIGEGTITHTGSGNFFNTSYHSYNPGNIRTSIGADVTVVTSGPLFYSNDLSGTSGIPKVKIWGNATVGSILSVDKVNDAIIAVYEGANLTVTGSDPMIFRNETGSVTYAEITLEGNVKVTDPDAVLLDDFVMTNKFGINTITKGTYTVSSVDAERIAMFLPDTLMLKSTQNDDGTTTYSVAEADCVHNWQLNAELSVKPQINGTGLDIFECSNCGTEKQTVTVYAPYEVEITIIVRTENGDEEYQVLAGDVLDFQFNGIGAAAVCYVGGIKDFGEIASDKIVGVEIPNGVVELVGFTNETLEEITLLDGTNITVSALAPFKALKTLNIGASTVIFNSVSSSCTLETINSTKEGATITFGSDAFRNVSAIKNLNMCKGCTYRFGSNSFNTSGLTRIIFPDDSNIIFDGDAAFYGSPNLKYVYFGTNCISDKKIYRKPFDCCYALENIVLMDIVYIHEYTFCCNGDFNSNKDYKEGKGEYKEALKVYSHNPDITFNANTFANRKVLGVNLYTAGTGVTSLSNCAYTIYTALAHNYTLETIEESTCVTQGKASYVTDCPCGIEYRNSVYTIYSTLNAELNGTVKEEFGTSIQDLPLSEEHTDSDIVNGIKFTNGYNNLGTKSFKCLYCDVTVGTEEEPSFPAIFSSARYSVPEDGRLRITVSYTVDLEALEQYETVMGELEYGVVGAITEKLGGKAPLEVTDVPVVKVPISNEYQSFDFIISGFDDTQLDLGVTMCAYVYDGTKYVYLQEMQVEIPISVSYNFINNQ